MPANHENAVRLENQLPVRVVLRPYASALPLGCFSFGIGNALLAAFALHWIPNSEKNTLAVMLLAFVAPLELIPCVMAFLSRDTGAATAMGIFAAAWTVQGVQLLGGDPSLPSMAIGIFLLLLSLCLAMLAFVTYPGKPLIGVLLTAAIPRCLTAALAQFGIHGAMDTANAIFDVVLALLALYSGAVLLKEDVEQKLNPLTFRQGPAKAALQGGLQEQVEHIANEAGVRQQL